MGYIRAEIEIIGTNKSKTIIALFDSGAHRNYLRGELEDGETPDGIGFHIYEGKHDAIMANGELAPGVGIRFKELRINGHTVSEPGFVVMENMYEYAIVGAELMQELGVILDPRNHELTIKPSNT